MLSSHKTNISVVCGDSIPKVVFPSNYFLYKLNLCCGRMVRTRSWRNATDLWDTLSHPNSHANSGASIHRQATSRNDQVEQNDRSPVRRSPRVAPPPREPAPPAGDQGREELRVGLVGRLDRFLDRVLDVYMAGEGQQASPPDPSLRSPPRDNI